MKILLIGFLTLASVSAFANEVCKVYDTSRMICTNISVDEQGIHLLGVRALTYSEKFPDGIQYLGIKANAEGLKGVCKAFGGKYKGDQFDTAPDWGNFNLRNDKLNNNPGPFQHRVLMNVICSP